MALYKIGEFSQRCGVSKDTLRYYDKAGILTPSYKADNGYRMYTEYDLMKLMQIRTLRGLDFPLGGCTKITTLSDMAGQLSSRMDELDQQIARLTTLRARVHMLQSEIESCLQHCGQCAQAVTIPTYNVNLERMTEEKRQLLSIWMHHTPYVHLSFSILDMTEPLAPVPFIGVLQSYADACALPLDGAESRPPLQAVRCVLRIADPAHPKRTDFAPLFDYMRSHDLVPAGPFMYRLRFIEQKSPDEEAAYYVGACVPTSKKT